jgi:hypothetical protein
MSLRVAKNRVSSVRSQVREGFAAPVWPRRALRTSSHPLSSSLCPLVQWMVAGKGLSAEVTSPPAKHASGGASGEGPQRRQRGLCCGPARVLPCGRWAGSGLASPSRAPRRTRNLRGQASGEDARSARSPLRRLPAPSEPWSGLRPPEKETPTRKTGPPSGG